MLKTCWLVLLAASVMPAGMVWAHGTVGDYTFLEPIVADDANPKNEFDILKPRWIRTSDGRQFSLGYSLEKNLIQAPESYSNGVPGGGLVSIEAGSAWIDNSPKDPSAPEVTGMDDLEMLAKWAFLTVPKHEFRLSIGAKFVIPTGNPTVESQNHTQIGPEFLWAKGFGDLPNRPYLKYLRPFGFQGDFGYVPAIGGSTFHHMFADNVVEYSVPYLMNSVKDIGLSWPLRNIYLYTEFNYDQLISGPPGQTLPQILATPGLAYMDYYCELSLATQIPLNNATIPNNHAAILGLVDLFIDDIFPWTNWTPL